MKNCSSCGLTFKSLDRGLCIKCFDNDFYESRKSWNEYAKKEMSNIVKHAPRRVIKPSGYRVYGNVVIYPESNKDSLQSL